MRQIAGIADGVHFNVPGAESVTDYEGDLLAVFRQIADDRPLILVKQPRSQSRRIDGRAPPSKPGRVCRALRRGHFGSAGCYRKNCWHQ